MRTRRESAGLLFLFCTSFSSWELLRDHKELTEKKKKNYNTCSLWDRNHSWERKRKDSTPFQRAAAERRRLGLSGPPYRICGRILPCLPASFHVSQGLGGAVPAAAGWSRSRRSRGSFPAVVSRSQVAAWAPSRGFAWVARGRRATGREDAWRWSRPRRQAVGAGSWAAAPGPWDRGLRTPRLGRAWTEAGEGRPGRTHWGPATAEAPKFLQRLCSRAALLGCDRTVLSWKSLPCDVVLRVVTVVWTSTPLLSTPWAGEQIRTVWLSLELVEKGEHCRLTSSEATRRELSGSIKIRTDLRNLPCFVFLIDTCVHFCRFSWHLSSFLSCIGLIITRNHDGSWERVLYVN